VLDTANPGPGGPDNWLSIGQEKFLIFISIVFILIYINGLFLFQMQIISQFVGCCSVAKISLKPQKF
jgi:hypothetical protein